MPLIKSISGIRGTIGEIEGEDLTTNDIVKFTSSFVTILVKNKKIIEKLLWVETQESQGQCLKRLLLILLLILVLM